MSGLVSIIMPSYNTGKFIKQTIESVLAQSYSNWELIIVDDCSPDNTDVIVKQFLRPADQSEAVCKYRADLGREFYQQFSDAEAEDPEGEDEPKANGAPEEPEASNPRKEKLLNYIKTMKEETT